MKNTRTCRPSGFALVVTLSLMILLTVIAVGLLTLSSINLRASSQTDAMRIAQANARAALMMAIGELQKTTGDDRRVTMAADLLPGSNENTTAALVGRRHWTGVYNAWSADTSINAESLTPRPEAETEFVSWLVSPPGLTKVADATSAAGVPARIQLVGPASAGPKSENWVEVGKVPFNNGTGKRGHLAWWVGDQGLKSSISTEKNPPTSLAGDARQSMQAASTADIRTMAAGTIKPYAAANLFDPKMRLLTSPGQSRHLIDTSAHVSAKELFHDMAVGSSGLLTNVRRGGFRKDLSMLLELNSTSTQRNALAQKVLYSVRSQNGVAREPGINMEELAAYYKLYTQLRPGSGSFTTDGVTLPSTASTLVFGSTPSDCRDDYYHFFKQPVPIAYDTFLSLEAQLGPVVSGVRTYNMRIVVDPVVIMWNPLDVPVRIPAASVPAIKYWVPPFTLRTEISGGSGAVTRMCFLQTSLSTGDHNYLSLDLSVTGTPLVFRPGEVMMISQRSKLLLGSVNKNQIPGGPGFSFQNGYSTPLVYADGSNQRKQLVVEENQTLRVSLEPNQYVIAKSGGTGLCPGMNGHSRRFSVVHHEVYLGKDRNAGSSLPIGGVYIDWDLARQRHTRNETLRTSASPGNKPDSQRMFANTLANLPTYGEPVTINNVADLTLVKKPFGYMSFRAKTEAGINGTSRGTSWLPRFNPKVFLQDFYNYSAEERDRVPYEFHMMRLTNLRDYGLLEQNNGRAYFGAAWSLGDGGQTSLITHSVPREPLISLAAFQHAMANGFLFIQPRDTPGNGFGTLNMRDPLNPQISHAIGNSLAPSVMQPDQTFSIMSDGSGRPFADHSYLANRALWDDYFLSSIAPQPAATTTLAGTNQRKLAEDFFNGTVRLPNRRYLANPGDLTPSEAINKLFNGNNPKPEAEQIVASLLRVDGMFNVNSTSVEAWKAVLSCLRESTVATANAAGTASVKEAGSGLTPVSGLLTPRDLVVGNSVFQDPAPWVGRRELSEDEIDALANAIVREVRRSGPFLSLADFVNRRVGSDKKLALAGVIERALRSSSKDVNDAFRSGDSLVSSAVAGRFSFPDAEQGFKSQGIPGIVKQADILTPIAPFISVRSDSFIIRAYGDALDSAGNVIGRAWCEAIVERDHRFIEESDLPETVIDNLSSNINKTFGRRYVIRSFRWLNASEV